MEDLIESASSLASNVAASIKTHHNDTELVRQLRDRGRVIEPLKDYHKDEVRELGIKLGLPKELVWRQPFPGPGLAVRILCAEVPFKDEHFESTNKLLKQILSKDTLNIDLSDELKSVLKPLEHLDTSSISATLLPVQTVGVQGDSRTYSYLVGLSGEKNWKTLFELARIIPQVTFYIMSDEIQSWK